MVQVEVVFAVVVVVVDGGGVLVRKYKNSGLACLLNLLEL